MIKRVDVAKLFCGEEETDLIEHAHAEFEASMKRRLSEQDEMVENLHKIIGGILHNVANSEELNFATLDAMTKNLHRIGIILKSLFEIEEKIQSEKKEALPNKEMKKISKTDLHIMLDACKTFGFIREGCEKDIPRILKEFEEDGYVTPYPYNVPPPDWDENSEKYQANPIGSLDEYFEKMIKVEDERAEWEYFMEKQLRARREAREAQVFSK